MNAITAISTASSPQPYTEIPTDNAALAEAITRLAGHINAAQYRFLKLLAALIEREAWSDGGAIKSPAHWLNYYCGIDLGAAREKVRVAKSLANLPRIDSAFASGAISYSKARAMTRSATPQNESFLLDIASHGTAHHVEMLVRKYQRTERQVGGSSSQIEERIQQHDQAQYQSRELSWRYDEDGMLVIRGRLTPEEGALFIKAVNGVFQQLPQSQLRTQTQTSAQTQKESQTQEEIENGKNVSAETSLPEPEVTFPQKRADALMLMAEHALQTLHDGLNPMAAADRHQVVIHIECDQRDQRGQSRLIHRELGNVDKVDGSNDNNSFDRLTQASIDAGPFISPNTARRLACDASLVTVLQDKHGDVLNIGRKSRAIPPALRRALTIRDRTCRFPGCCDSRFVDAHHIHHWCDGGETRLDNLLLLCRRHHRLVHDPGFDLINHDAGNVEFLRPDRKIIHPALFPQFCEDESAVEQLAIERQHQEMGLIIDGETAVCKWNGEAMDFNMAVGEMQGLGAEAENVSAETC